MDLQNNNEPTNVPANSNESSEGGIVIDHNSGVLQPQAIRPTVIQPYKQSEQPIPPKPVAQPVNPQNPISAQPKPNVVVVPPVPPTQNPITTSAVPQPTVASTPASLPAIEPVETDGIDNPQWQYHSGKLKTEYEDYDNSYKTDEVQKDPQNAGIIWSASEFVSHQKNTKWYVLLGVGAVVVSGVLYLVTREIFSIVVVVILAIALGVFGAVKPKTLDYAIGDDGIQIGPKQFPYTTFHSFAVIDDAAIAYIQLLPQKRFMAPISIYFAPEDEKKIVDYLGEHLPLEHKKRDFTDKLASRIHF